MPAPSRVGVVPPVSGEPDSSTASRPMIADRPGISRGVIGKSRGTFRGKSGTITLVHHPVEP